MRCHDVSRAQNCDTKNSHKIEREERQQNKRLSAHQSATSTTLDLNRVSILCDSQKHITCLDTHHKTYLKHFHSSMDHNQRYERDEDFVRLPAPSLMPKVTVIFLHTITAMGIWASPSKLTYAAENSRKHHQTLEIHALTLAEQSLGESVMAISPSTPQRLRLSEYLEAHLPMECVPEISLCLGPALNRGSLR